MKAYEFQMMDRSDYHTYMTGGYNYHVEYTTVIAETPEIAERKVKLANPGMVINSHAKEVPLATPCEDQMTIADLLG